MVKEGSFAIYGGRPVAVHKIEGNRATVRHIQRDWHDKEEVVRLADLFPFTEKNAHAAISEYNMRIHAFRECLRYI